MKKSRLPRALRILLWSALAALLAIFACNCWLLAANRARISAASTDVPARTVALVLGTAPRVGQWKNLFFEGRMDAAAQLWRAGKTRHLLVSGDNSRRDYDEPTAMRDALIARGVPARAITLDYAGFRTLDSLVRAREVFGLHDIIVVTDAWHQPRALFLAAAAGLDALGASSADLVCILRTKPKFLGEPVALPVE